MIKKSTLISLLLIILFGKVSAQTIFSNGTGGGAWGSQCTLLEGVVPNINIDVLIFFCKSCE